MTTLLLFQIIFFVIVILVTILFFIIVFTPKEPDYKRIEELVALYKMMTEQEEENLKTLNLKNKEIDKIEEQILICKKKLGWKLFKDSN